MKGITCHGFKLAALAWLAILSAAAKPPSTPPAAANPSTSIPMDQLGAVAGKQYHGDGLSVAATSDGAQLRCAFQRLEGEVTRDGLWLRSTAENAPGERFRVVAVAVGRTEDFGVRWQSAAPTPLFESDWMEAALPEFQSGVALCFPPQSKTLPVGGAVSVNGQTVRFSRPGLTEEYSVSVDGVRQDFIVEQRPEGEGELRVELDVTGARVEPLVNGARLVLAGSGRKLAYNRLRVTDATGRELPARMEVAAGVSPAVEGGILPPGSGARTTEVSGFHCDEFASSGFSAGLEATALRQAQTPAATRLAVLVDDTAAIYPVRIDPTFSDADWTSMGGWAGTDKTVRSAVVDADGNLYIGGDFTAAGEIAASRIAKWNGSNWSALGSGMNSTVFALAVMGTDLYAGGSFTTAGGIAASRIAKWDGSAWAALGTGISGSSLPSVSALAGSGSDLYAGGTFTTAGGNPANFVAKWNGGIWTALGSGMNSNVAALAVSDGDVYAGGTFTTADDIPVNRIAKWTGGAWTALGSGMNSNVSALAVSGGEVYAGGAFTTAGGGAANRIAKWNGSTWTALGSGMNTNVSALAVSGGVLYAGGTFTTAGSSTVSRIARWNGSAWTALGSGINNSVLALAASGGAVYAGGTFTTAGTIADHVAKWSGSSWKALGLRTVNAVRALAISGTNLYAGGAFSSAGGVAVSGVAKWNGTSWTLLGSGMTGALSSVITVAVSDTNLYAGGFFTIADGNTVNFIARWNGISWVPLGSGMNGYVWALAFLGDDLYVGGSFETAGGIPANGIAKWDGNSWSALGLGVGDQVSALATSGSNLYVGGNFTTAGGNPANSIAKWDGVNWSTLGSGLFIAFPSAPTVAALAVLNGDVYAGGNFTHAGGNAATNLAKWNGTNWSSLGSGLNPDSDSRVWALTASGSDLYAGGYFTKAGGNVVNYIAAWNGSSWSSLGSGMSSYVYALATSGNDLYAGGAFVAAGNKVSVNAAKAYVGPARGRFSDLVYSPSTGFSCIFLDASAGQPYRIQSSPSLAAGPWTDLTNFIYASPIVITDASPVSATNTFYRAVTP